MHSDCWGCKRVVGWEDEGAPVLAVEVGGVWWAGEDIMPSMDVRASVEGEEGTDSRMLDSEGWAMINGGGFSAMVLYSRVNCILSG